MKRISVFLFALLLLPLVAWTQSTVGFQWDPHGEATTITGFRLYQTLTPGVYGMTPVATFSGGALTTGSLPKPGIGNYCWSLTAFKDVSGTILESGRSNEVCKTLVPINPTGFKITSGPMAQKTGKKEYLIAWKTSDPSSTILVYNREGFPPIEIRDPRPVTDHMVVISNLQPNQLWRYTVRSELGEEMVEATGSFVSR